MKKIRVLLKRLHKRVRSLGRARKVVRHKVIEHRPPVSIASSALETTFNHSSASITLNESPSPVLPPTPPPVVSIAALDLATMRIGPETPLNSSSNASIRSVPNIAITFTSVPKTRECSACMDKVELNHFPEPAADTTCQHEMITTCTECLAAYIEAQATVTPLDEIICPEPECKTVMDYNRMRQYASKKVFEHYDAYLTNKAMRGVPGFLECVNRLCYEAGFVDGTSLTFMDCNGCNTKTCVGCKGIWYSGLTCEQEKARLVESERRSAMSEKDRRLEDDQDTVSTAWVEKESKACPNESCGVRIQKVSGCDHMRCKRCKHEFCWICFVSYVDIRKNGNDAHANTCPHYRTIAPPRRPLQESAAARQTARVAPRLDSANAPAPRFATRTRLPPLRGTPTPGQSFQPARQSFADVLISAIASTPVDSGAGSVAAAGESDGVTGSRFRGPRVMELSDSDEDGEL